MKEYRRYDVTFPEYDYKREIPFKELQYGKHYSYDDFYGDVIINHNNVRDLIAEELGEAIKTKEFVLEMYTCEPSDERPNVYDYLNVEMKGFYQVSNVKLLTEESFNENRKDYDWYDTYKDYVVGEVTDQLTSKYWNTFAFGFDYLASIAFKHEGRTQEYYDRIYLREIPQL